ncbi:Tyrosyl-DNA phosphodiesterase 2 [Gossypium australe]|uniref:Tyrosyl-DNA phosphodiesterase 2 n=1 Tax=Gossypium australe TaxID=47621 RepID=A0A5B6WBA2_9ROSI|nr:Tyrosyl-DNA phosphodiesterase 2 [Gossypium australe]
MAFAFTPLRFLTLNPRPIVIISKTLKFPPFPSPIFNPNTKTMSWSCTKCTFLNSPSQTAACKICLSPPSPPPSPSSPSKWACKACTFLNLYNKSNCEICGTRSCLSSFDDLKVTDFNDEADSSVGSVFLPLKPCNKRKIREPNLGNEDCIELGGFRGIKASNKAVQIEDSNSGSIKASLKILSYNVWFREDLEVHKRMKAIGDLIQLHSPDILCFQEVTPMIYDIFRGSNWWKGYRCSISDDTASLRAYFCIQLSKLPVKSFRREPFDNSIMGRELCMTEVEVFGGETTLVVATTHLESPCPAPPKWDQMYSKERVEQAKVAINILENNPNVIFGGDMNWDDKLDGRFPLTDGWIDAWNELRPAEDGWTYDTKSNQMLSANRTLRKRLDRFLCKLNGFKVCAVEMIGVEPIPGLSYTKEKNVRKEKKLLELPVLPSDHYGLLLTISNQ